MSVSSYYLTPEHGLSSNLNESEIKQAYESKAGLLWVDISETTENDALFLARVLKFHSLAVEDCINPGPRPAKIDDFGEYIFVIMHGINHVMESDVVETAELDVFLGANFVVSNHNYPLYSIEAVKLQVEKDGRFLQKGADFLAHALADTLIDNVMPTIDQIVDVIEDVEDEAIRLPKQNTLETILKLKRSSLRIHRVMVPQREIFNRLSRGDFSVIKDEAGIFYRDVYDHLVRIEDLNQTIRDRIDNAMSMYLSSVANRQNEVMKTLAVVATIFMPLTLLVGIYGMNFDNMPELHWKWGYFVVVGVIVIAIGTVLWRFWAKGWISWGRKRMKHAVNLVVDGKKIIGYTERIVRRRR